MTELEGIIIGLIRSVKQNNDFSDIRFINAYNSQPAEKPVEGYLAVVEIAEIDEDINLQIRLIGGSDVSGSQLGYTALELAAALKTADSDMYIKSVRLSETKYDKNITAFYRDIKLGLSLDTEISEENGIILHMGSELINGVTAFRWEEKSESVSLYEFNRSEPYAVINSKTAFEITLEMKSASFIGFENGFTITLQDDSGTISFLNCAVNKVSVSVNTSGQVVYTAKIISNRKVTA